MTPLRSNTTYQPHCGSIDHSKDVKMKFFHYFSRNIVKRCYQEFCFNGHVEIFWNLRNCIDDIRRTDSGLQGGRNKLEKLGTLGHQVPDVCPTMIDVLTLVGHSVKILKMRRHNAFIIRLLYPDDDISLVLSISLVAPSSDHME